MKIGLCIIILPRIAQVKRKLPCPSHFRFRWCTTKRFTIPLPHRIAIRIRNQARCIELIGVDVINLLCFTSTTCRHGNIDRRAGGGQAIIIRHLRRNLIRARDRIRYHNTIRWLGYGSHESRAIKERHLRDGATAVRCRCS
ncbi:hypothetical protein S2091_4720 [Solimicrobium silvestre]|uniref:Uncharacterized protein n=1 Tax=Solimicrobium silvestre TaxID=2099400 RepID=A0A2S9GS83_9BURK|nr:hypothetical protein S2091_4720 [Solimicrobium silvestre]